MLTIKRNVVLLIVLCPLILLGQNQESKDINKDFEQFFFECLINGDFEKLKESFIIPPKEIILKQKRGQDRKYILNDETAAKLFDSYKTKFDDIQLKLKGEKFEIQKIATESNFPFQATDIYLYIESDKSTRYTIKLEGVLHEKDKYLFEQIKLFEGYKSLKG